MKKVIRIFSFVERKDGYIFHPVVMEKEVKNIFFQFYRYQFNFENLYGSPAGFLTEV